jgi:hypothetical protein
MITDHSPRSTRKCVFALSAALFFAAAVKPSAAPNATLVWESGFENGFPGSEWLDYDNGAFTGNETPNPGTRDAWTIVDTSQFADIPAGDHAYKGWVFAQQSESHRPYPGIHCDIASPLVNSFLVWQEAEYDQLDPSEWIHFATWGNNSDWVVHTMSVRDRKVEMAHCDWSYIGPEPQPDFPLAQWVRFTAYIDYTDNGYIRVWQDGVAIFEGHFTARTGDNLLRAHWGLYCSGSIDNAVQYNDEIKIWSLHSRLTDLATEPVHGWTSTRIDPAILQPRRRLKHAAPLTAPSSPLSSAYDITGRRLPGEALAPRPVIRGVSRDHAITISVSPAATAAKSGPKATRARNRVSILP